jgi:hypothetical protein
MLLQKMGIAMRAAVRSQINLVMAASEHIKQLKGVRDIIYPILWFQVSSSQRSKFSFVLYVGFYSISIYKQVFMSFSCLFRMLLLNVSTSHKYK